eukprot:4652494-Prymnesium_polylepis.1
MKPTCHIRQRPQEATHQKGSCRRRAQGSRHVEKGAGEALSAGQLCFLSGVQLRNKASALPNWAGAP